MKTFLVFFSALILMIIIGVAKDFAFLNFVAPPHGGSINVSIFMGTLLAPITFSGWAMSLRRMKTLSDKLGMMGATMLLTLMLPFAIYVKTGDMSIMLNLIASIMLGILFAHLAHLYNKRMVVS